MPRAIHEQSFETGAELDGGAQRGRVRNQVGREIEGGLAGVLGHVQAECLVAGQVERSHLQPGESFQVDAIDRLREPPRINRGSIEQRRAADPGSFHDVDQRADQDARNAGVRCFHRARARSLYRAGRRATRRTAS